jgi:type III pantothenate kinase
MILCLDVGNSQIHAGVFDGEKLVYQFRKNSSVEDSSDQLGVFLRSVLRENGLDPQAIANTAICTVVPASLYSLRAACIKYFGQAPFVLQAGVKTGLKIRYKNPQEVGADRIANAIAAAELFPNQNRIVVDFGTATTCDVITAGNDYLGGAILPGLKLSMNALQAGTAKLSAVEILKPEKALGQTTAGSVQSGLYFGHLHALRGLLAQLATEAFGQKPVTVIGTGGFAGLFAGEGLFDHEVPDLVLTGLRLAFARNRPLAA